MTRKQFQNYLTSYCVEMCIPIPLYEERTKLYKGFITVNYSDLTDTECALWEFLDENLGWASKKIPMENDCMTTDDLIKAKDHLMRKGKDELMRDAIPVKSNYFKELPTPVCLADLNVCIPKCKINWTFPAPACRKEEKEEGNNPVYNETEASRNYLNSRLRDARDKSYGTAYETFRMANHNFPVTYKELIDAIKNDKFSLDAKRTAQIDVCDKFYGGPFEGIVFTLDNSPDTKGYNAAIKQIDKAYVDAKDVIFTSDAASGLKALQAFETSTVPLGNG